MGCSGCGGGRSNHKSTRVYCPICGTRLNGNPATLPKIGGKFVCPKCSKNYDKAKNLENTGRAKMIENRKKNVQG